ncbi:MAG: sugar phosphate isomerase/epimerase [Spirochaetaceae bacterium]|jgi:sugar phosphate isomerase/epimerase|nr:sugar phosphate isomerase/epimerase [Spirochaetaceae bacterium]
MKLGLLSAILENMTYEEVIDTASELGYESVELACWPRGEGGRRYAGTSHIDVNTLTIESCRQILSYASSKNIEIQALGYYPNPLDPDKEKSDAAFKHIKSLIEGASLLKINRISTFIGRDKNKTIEENLEIFSHLWPEIISYAEKFKVQVAIENCPMYFSKDEWPGGLNLASSPFIWKKMFEIIDSPFFGLSYDPSHLYLQRMDYISPLKDFKDKIFHIHLKDIAIDEKLINEHGIFTHPLNYMNPRIPGRGGINWKEFISVLKKTGFSNCACVEIEDKDYEDNGESILKALKESYEFIKPLM